MDEKDIRIINTKLKLIEKKLDRILECQDGSIVEDRLISVKEASEILGVSENALRKEIHDGNIPAHKTARAYKLSYFEVVKRVGYKIHQKNRLLNPNRND